MTKEFHSSCSDCLKEEAKSYKMQRPSHNQPHRTHSKDGSEDRGTTERKIEDVLGEDQFGFRREKGTTDAVGMLRIISKEHWALMRNCVLAS